MAEIISPKGSGSAADLPAAQISELKSAPAETPPAGTLHAESHDRAALRGLVADPELCLAVIRSTPGIFMIVEADGTLAFVNADGAHALGVSRGVFADDDGVCGRDWMDAWPLTAQAGLSEAFARALAGETARLEVYSPAGSRPPTWWAVSLSPVAAANAALPRVLCLARDISERVRLARHAQAYERTMQTVTEDQADRIQAQADELDDTQTAHAVIMREIDHRVKNSLAVVAGLLRLQSRATDVPEARRAIEAASERVRAIAEVHARLYLGTDIDNVDMADLLGSLCAGLERVAVGDIRITADIDAATLAHETAVAIGLIVSELVGNAARHAFVDQDPAARRGRIDVTYRHGETHVLEVSDDGAGLPERFDLAAATASPKRRASRKAEQDTDQKTGKDMGERPGDLGMRIVQIYTRQLEGELTHRARAPRGTVFRLEF